MNYMVQDQTRKMDKAVKTYIAVLKAEIAHLKSKEEPTQMGDVKTTINSFWKRITVSTLENRVRELEQG